MADLIGTIPIVLIWLFVTIRLSRQASSAERSLLWASFVLHQVSAVGMVIMTRHYYEGGDMLGYQRFGTLVAGRLREDFVGNILPVLGVVFRRPDPLPFPVPILGGATGSMEGFAALLMFIGSDSLYAACAFMGGATFVAKVAMYRVMKSELSPVSAERLLVATALFPSVVFWSSGMLKEPIAMVGLGMMCHGGYRIVLGSRARGVAWLTTGVVLVGLVKTYVLPPFGVAAAIWYYLRSVQRKRAAGFGVHAWYALVALALGVGVVLLVGAYVPAFAPEQIADEAVRHQSVGARIQGGSNYSLGGGAGTATGQLSLVPLAVITVFFRPAIFEAGSVVVFLSALEMTVVSVLFIRAFLLRSPAAALRDVVGRPALAFCAVFSLTMAVGIGLGTTNLGSLSRYRIPMMPFFGTLLLALTAQRPARAAAPIERVGGAQAVRQRRRRAA